MGTFIEKLKKLEKEYSFNQVLQRIEFITHKNGKLRGSGDAPEIKAAYEYVMRARETLFDMKKVMESQEK